MACRGSASSLSSPGAYPLPDQFQDLSIHGRLTGDIFGPTFERSHSQISFMLTECAINDGTPVKSDRPDRK